MNSSSAFLHTCQNNSLNVRCDCIEVILILLNIFHIIHIILSIVEQSSRQLMALVSYLLHVIVSDT